MKLTKEQSEQIFNRYQQLKVEGVYKKGYIQQVLRKEFPEFGKTTLFDHSRGRERGSNYYKVFGEVSESAMDQYDIVVEVPKEPKILFFDIETFANIAYVWGKYEQNVIDFEREWFVLCFCYKWLNKDAVHSVALPDFPLYKQDKTNDFNVIQAMWELFNEADIVVAHNGDQFDIKKINARFLYHGMPPPSPFKSIDTKKVAKRYFNMNSNKLDDIGRYLGIGRKVVNTGWDLWKRCETGDLQAWKEMLEYNTQDVVLLEKVYEKFKPFITTHPNYNLYKETTNCCPNCGSQDLVEQGLVYSRISKAKRYQCNSCKAWSQGNKLVR